MQRLQTAQNRNAELEACWRRPENEQPVYSELKYLVRYVHRRVTAIVMCAFVKSYAFERILMGCMIGFWGLRAFILYIHVISYRVDYAIMENAMSGLTWNGTAKRPIPSRETKSQVRIRTGKI